MNIINLLHVSVFFCGHLQGGFFFFEGYITKTKEVTEICRRFTKV
jgi:hypothetical protein